MVVFELLLQVIELVDSLVLQRHYLLGSLLLEALLLLVSRVHPILHPGSVYLLAFDLLVRYRLYPLRLFALAELLYHDSVL